MEGFKTDSGQYSIEQQMVGNTIKKIAIITEVPFPNGYAPANRILSYYQGFKANGVDCEIIIVVPNKIISNKNISASGFIEEIKYKYPGGIVSYHNKLLIRKIQYYFSLIASLFYILFSYFIRKKVDLIIYYGSQPIFEIILITLSKIFNLSICKEQSEIPFIHFRFNRLFSSQFLELIYLKYIFKNYTCILAMTQNLKGFFSNNGISEERIIVVNNTASIVNLKNSFDYKKDEIYFAYTGSLNQNKDGVLTMIEAFAKVLCKHSTLKLKIAGFGSTSEVEALNDKITKLNISDNIIMLGALTAIESKNLIFNATGLISARPSSIQAEYGFPTKIVEYLASGNPVLTTLTGSLGLFLKHNFNAFVSPPNNAERLALTWLFMLDDLANARKVGKEGRELVKNKFNPVIETEKIINHFNKYLS